MMVRSFVRGLVLLVIVTMPRGVEAFDFQPESDEVALSRSPSPVGKEGWRQLRSRMTQDDVRAILGAPPWTDRLLRFEFWMYEVPSALASGVIVFEEGRVFSWRLPSRP